jgi:DNA-binding CsgD family transcriptional regulator
MAAVARTKLSPKLPKLNEREIETLTWVARGKTSTQIAGKLGLVKRNEILRNLECVSCRS